jgi:hypothetical protein
MTDIYCKGLSLILRHTKKNNKKRIQETFASAGLQVELQERRLSLVVITMGRKNRWTRVCSLK